MEFDTYFKRGFEAAANDRSDMRVVRYENRWAINVSYSAPAHGDTNENSHPLARGFENQRSRDPTINAIILNSFPRKFLGKRSMEAIIIIILFSSLLSYEWWCEYFWCWSISFVTWHFAPAAICQQPQPHQLSSWSRRHRVCRLWYNIPDPFDGRCDFRILYPSILPCITSKPKSLLFFVKKKICLKLLFFPSQQLHVRLFLEWKKTPLSISLKTLISFFIVPLSLLVTSTLLLLFFIICLFFFVTRFFIVTF